MEKSSNVRQIYNQPAPSRTEAGDAEAASPPLDPSHAEMLLGISRRLALCETLDQILQELMDIITKEVNADRGSVFLKDSESNELYSRLSRQDYHHEIRILADSGVAGHVFTSGETANVPNAYENEHFDKSVDGKTGYRTRSILCVPVRNVRDEIIGVAQVLNKKRPGVRLIRNFGRDVIPFTEEDEFFVDAVTTQAAVALQMAQTVERVEKARLREQKLLDVVADITSEIDLGKILQKVMDQASKMIASDRSTLFLNDEKTGELFSKIAAGLNDNDEDGVPQEIRLLNTAGIAGTVFTSGHSVNIPYAYSDLRFNPGFDKQTGYFTRSILCVPVNNKQGKTIGVIQLLNKRKGVFTEEDEAKLRTFTAQVSIALENAKLFDDVQNIKNRNEGMLESMSSGVITLNEEGRIETCNAAGLTILNIEPEEIIDKQGEAFFADITHFKITEESIFRMEKDGVPQDIVDDLKSQKDKEFKEVGVFSEKLEELAGHRLAGVSVKDIIDDDIEELVASTRYFKLSEQFLAKIREQGISQEIIGKLEVLKHRVFPDAKAFSEALQTVSDQILPESDPEGFYGGQAIGILNSAAYFKTTEQILEKIKEKETPEDVISRLKPLIAEEFSGISKAMEAMENRVADYNKEAEKNKNIVVKQARFFIGPNAWILDKIRRLEYSHKGGESNVTMDAKLVFGKEVSANVTVLPLISTEKKKLGSMVMFEDISNEKRMKSTMSRYMDPDVAERLLSGSGDALGGRSSEATVLFSDIRSFTTMTEKLGAQGTVSFLNEYFTIMVECIQKEGGMLDKFIGDAIMAAFGIPVEYADSAERGVRASISMLREMFRWNEERIAGGEDAIDMGIGLNTGTIVTGNIGSPKRMDYTMIGDGVNLASRLESACKQYHSRLLISEFTYEKLTGSYKAREIDKVVVKGKTEAVSIYEILDYHTEESFPNMRKVLDIFEEGIKAYRAMKWDQAVEAFEEIKLLHPGDELSQDYIERCEELKKFPPPSDWGGVKKMTSK